MAGTPTSRATTEAIRWQELQTLLPAENLRAATPNDSVSGCVPAYVATPADEQQMSSVLRWANQNAVSVTVIGGGTKQEWLAPPQVLDLLISTSKLNRVIEHAHEDMTATVQAGVTVEAFQSLLGQHKQRLALDALWPDRATIGGVIAANDSGALRLRYGSIRDLLIGATIVLPDGTIARSGGKVVKNVAGYDLPKLFTGSFGTLGVLTEATFRVHPLPRNSSTLSFRFHNDRAANKFLLAINDSTLVPAAVQFRCGTDYAPTIDVLLEVVEAGITAQTASLQRLAAEGERTTSASPWAVREEIWAKDAHFVVCKVAVLPSDIAVFAAELRSRCREFDLVIQATGLGYFCARCSSAMVDQLRAKSGNLTVVRGPKDFTADRFGPGPDSLPIMARVKQRFDPNGILNRGRFLGGV